MKNRINLLTAFGEAAIPLIGLLLFDWGLYFILLFYFIDLISAEVFSYIKVNKVVQFQQLKFPFSAKQGRLLFNTGLVLLILVLSHFAVYFISPNINFYSELIEFIQYEEAGIPIPQGYILIPLVVLGNFQQYKLTFIRSQAYKVVSWKELILSRRKYLYVAVFGCIIGILSGMLFSIPEYIYILLIVGVKFYIDAFLIKV